MQPARPVEELLAEADTSPVCDKHLNKDRRGLGAE